MVVRESFKQLFAVTIAILTSTIERHVLKSVAETRGTCSFDDNRWQQAVKALTFHNESRTRCEEKPAKVVWLRLMLR